MIGPEDTEKSVYAALKMGYRLIDTANAYVNEEAVAGDCAGLWKKVWSNGKIFSFRRSCGRRCMKRQELSIRPWNGWASTMSICCSSISRQAIIWPGMRLSNRPIATARPVPWGFPISMAINWKNSWPMPIAPCHPAGNAPVPCL